MNKPDAILIAGPTASGKSNFALELAETHDGEIINTDSMQIFPVLRILTARPNEADLARVPHHLYGTTPLEGPSSVAIWMADAERVANEIWSRGKTAIFVGGTGLYFRGLEHGLAQVPDVHQTFAQMFEKGCWTEAVNCFTRNLCQKTHRARLF